MDKKKGHSCLIIYITYHVALFIYHSSKISENFIDANNVSLSENEVKLLNLQTYYLILYLLESARS